MILRGFGEGSGRVLGGFREGSGRVLGGFREGLESRKDDSQRANKKSHPEGCDFSYQCDIVAHMNCIIDGVFQL
jgi:hypothetical protein